MIKKLQLDAELSRLNVQSSFIGPYLYHKRQNDSKKTIINHLISMAYGFLFSRTEDRLKA